MKNAYKAGTAATIAALMLSAGPALPANAAADEAIVTIDDPDRFSGWLPSIPNLRTASAIQTDDEGRSAVYWIPASDSEAATAISFTRSAGAPLVSATCVDQTGNNVNALKGGGLSLAVIPGDEWLCSVGIASAPEAPATEEEPGRVADSALDAVIPGDGQPSEGSIPDSGTVIPKAPPLHLICTDGAFSARVSAEGASASPRSSRKTPCTSGNTASFRPTPIQTRTLS